MTWNALNGQLYPLLASFALYLSLQRLLFFFAQAVSSELQVSSLYPAFDDVHAVRIR